MHADWFGTPVCRRPALQAMTGSNDHWTHARPGGLLLSPVTALLLEGAFLLDRWTPRLEIEGGARPDDYPAVARGIPITAPLSRVGVGLAQYWPGRPCA